MLLCGPPAHAGAYRPVMRVTHVALWARDLDAVCAFYEHLGASRGELYTNPRTGFTSRFLSWPRSDVRLEVMHRADMEESRDAGLGWAQRCAGAFRRGP